MVKHGLFVFFALLSFHVAPVLAGESAGLIGAIPATEAQSAIALKRAEAILSALDDAEFDKLLKKRPLVAVRTLNATEEQIATLREQAQSTGVKYPETPPVLIMVCDMQNKRVSPATCYAFAVSPRGNSLVKLGDSTARFLDSF